MFHRLRFSLLLLLAGIPLVSLFYPLRAAQASPSTAYAIAWVNTYKHLTAQPVCTGSGIASQYFGGEECGFGVFTISPADPNKTINLFYKDAQGNTFFTGTATYNSTNNEYDAGITPAASWPPGPIVLQATMAGPDTGSSSTSFYLNWLHLTPASDKAQYAPGNPITVTGSVYRRTGTNVAPVDVPVGAAITVTLVNPDNNAILGTQTTTANGSGAWSVTFAGGTTAGFVTNDYEARVSATWTDGAAVFGPAQWRGAATTLLHFQTPATNLTFFARETATDGIVRAGDTFLYVLSAQNGTASNATSLQFRAVLPPGAVFVSSVPAPTSGTGTSGNPLQWNFATLAANGAQNVYLYARAKTQVEDHTIVWQLLDLSATLNYTHNAQAKAVNDTTLGPKVVPAGEVGDSVRHGRRTFPVALVDYLDLKHDNSHTGDYFKDSIFTTVISRYLEMSFGQLLPVPVLPSVGRGNVPFGTETYHWSTLQPNGFCSGTTTAGQSGNPSDPNGPPLGATNRIADDWYQLPGTQGYYGSDSSASNYAGALSGVGALVNVDNGCGAPGKIVYDAATLMDPDVDYNDFDADRDGWVDFFELAYQGQPENIIGQTGVNNVWPHSANLRYQFPNGYVSNDQLRDHQDRLIYSTDAGGNVLTTTVTAFPVMVKVGAYNVNAEFSDQVTFSHEYGHSLGLPDNYSLGSRTTMGNWDLMSSGNGHMSIWDKQELGWLVPVPLSSTINLRTERELKIDTHSIQWTDNTGATYVLTGSVHNADVYKVNLPKVQLFDSSLIPSGRYVYYSQAGNDFGYPGHIFDLAFDGSLTAGGSTIQLAFKSWYEMEKDYDYGYLQVSTDGGQNWTNLPSQQGTTTNTNPQGNNHGNGITCVSGAQADPSCGTVSYPTPVFITDTFDLSAYAGQDIIVRWAYSTDPGLAKRGWVIDDIRLLKDSATVYFDNAENEIQSHGNDHVYNGWLRSNGGSTAEHAYWIGVRDRTGFDLNAGFQPGVVIEYANEARNYGNVGVDNGTPPALTVIDSVPQPKNDQPNLDDAAWRPNPGDPGNPAASNRDYYTDCDNAGMGNAPRHIDNYTDNSNATDGAWHLGFDTLKMLVRSLSGEGSGAMTATILLNVPANCAVNGIMAPMYLPIIAR